MTYVRCTQDCEAELRCSCGECNANCVCAEGHANACCPYASGVEIDEETRDD